MALLVLQTRDWCPVAWPPLFDRSLSPNGDLQQTIDAMDGVPVVVQNRRLDAIGSNHLGRALFAQKFVMTDRPVNAARFVFLSEASKDLYDDWDQAARQAVAVLRAEAGRDPFDRKLTDMIGELSTKSEPFRTLWASHDVKEHRTGTKRIHHPLIGDVDLAFEVMELVTDPGQQIVVYSAVAGSPSHDALKLLASWNLTSFDSGVSS